MAISILALAVSLSYFTYELSLLIQQIPNILKDIRQTSEKVQPVLERVDKIQALIPPIIEEVRQVRQSIPPVLLEVEKTRQQIPPVLEEVAAVRKQLPSLLASVDQASATMQTVSAEMKAYEPIIANTLVQVEGIRKEVPDILSRTEAIISSARTAAREASSGAITGTIGGLLTAPFRLVGDFGRSILDLTDEKARDYSRRDLALIQQYGIELAEEGKVGDFRELKNSETGYHLRLSLTKVYSKSGQACRSLFLEIWKNTKLDLQKTVNLCINDEDEWEYQ